MAEELTLENVIKRCGDFNRFQLIHYICLSLLNFSSGLTGFYYVFGLAEPEFRCRLPSNICPNDTLYDSCNGDRSYFSNDLNMFQSKCNNLNGTPCKDFVYDRSVFGKTFTEEAGYVCSNSIAKTWLSTAYQIGTFSILITGTLADRFGRRKVIQISTITLLCVSVFIQILLQFIEMNTNSKVILLFINQVVSAIDSYSTCFLLLMELTSSSHTSFACGIAMVAYTIGEILVALFAYFSRDWLLLKWMTSVYFAMSIPYLYFVPESPYWLFSRKKYRELELCLKRMAKVNQRPDEEWLPYYERLIDENRFTQITTHDERSSKQKYLQHLPRLAIGGFIEFVTMLLYTKISYGLGESNQTVSPYSNFIIGAFVETFGYLLASLLIITPLGRKFSLIIFSSFTSVCVLIIPLIMKPYVLGATIVLQLGKLTVSSTVSVSWIYVPELFPTNMRGVANAVFVFVGSFGSILAPIVDEALGEHFIQISFYVYSGLIIVLALIICTLPETRNHSFDEKDDSKIERSLEIEEESRSALISSNVVQSFVSIVIRDRQ